jgi:TRAP transporter TAXI family solute receptor
VAAVAPLRSRVLLSLASAALSLLLAGAAEADDLRFFQLGTGPTSETRFSLGGLIANALSNPPGARPCDHGGSCGVPGLVAVATSTAGSVADVDAVAEHRIDAALVDADVVSWAVHGTGPFAGRPETNLRGIAVVYPESLHVVVRHGTGIRRIKDLRGRHVSFGDGEAGALSHQRLLLDAYGLSDHDVKISPMTTAAAADALAAGRIDAMVVADAWPVPEVAELARTTAIDVLPLAGAAADKLVADNPYLSPGEIAADVYDGVTGPVRTLDIGVVLVTAAEADPELVKGVTRALWQPSTRKLLADGNLHGHLVHLDADALARIGLQLHPGAAAYYAEAKPSP